ncbi:MAG TPA: carboxypeptidase-like regulatory domain-containing protein [Planctomycetota bacterium]
MGAALVAGALFLLPIGIGLVSPRSRQVVEPPGAPVTPELEPPPSRLATPRPAHAAADGPARATTARASAETVEPAGGAGSAPPATPAHGPALARLELHVLGAAAPASIELLHEPADGGPARRSLHASDAGGRLALALAPGSARAVAWSDAATAPPGLAELSAGATTVLELALAPALPVLGRVLDAESGAPVAGARVAFWTFAEADEVVSGPDGTFRHPRFPAAAPAQQIAARAQGFGTTVRVLRLAPDGAWKLAARHAGEASLRGRGTPWIELELVREQRLRGRVVDAGGAPLAGVRVAVEGFQRAMTAVASPDAATTTSAADGGFELGGLRSDLGHALTLAAPGLAGEPLELPPATGLVELGTLVLRPATFLTGVVLDADGLPRAGAEVVLRPMRPLPTPAGPLDAGARAQSRERRATTCVAGTFLFEDLLPAPAWLVVETEAGERAETTLVPGPDGIYDTPCLALGPAALAQRGP